MNSYLLPYPAKPVRWTLRAPGTRYLLPVHRVPAPHAVQSRRLPVTVGRLTGRSTGDVR